MKNETAALTEAVAAAYAPASSSPEAQSGAVRCAQQAQPSSSNARPMAPMQPEGAAPLAARDAPAIGPPPAGRRRRWRGQGKESASLSRKVAKHVISALGYHSRMLELLSWLRNRCGGSAVTILMYHRVLPREQALIDPDPGICTTLDTFEAQMRFIARHCTPVGLVEVVASLRSGAAPPRGACVITFDDGWRDSYTYAFPVLRQLGIPATLFVATAHVSTATPLWTRLLSYAIRSAVRRGDCRVIEEVLADHGAGTAGDPARPRTVAGRVKSALKRMPAARREPIVCDLLTALGEQRADDEWVTWDQLREMAGAGIAIGSHTRTHEILTTVGESQVRNELEGSRADIERELGAAPTAVAYPDGAVNELVAHLARQAGYECGCGTAPGWVTRRTPFADLPRISMHEDATAALRGGFSPAAFVRATTCLPSLADLLNSG